ncbi:MAG: hypothetical protein HFG31_09055 [Eubacterium sp.]|nr:hypothetical protein [Eubacterium sp.]
MKNQQKRNNIHFKKNKFRSGIVSKFILKQSGKKDGKKSIPFIHVKHIISPNVKKEHDKVYLYMAYIMQIINMHNANYYYELQSMIANLETKVNEAVNLNQILGDKPSDTSMFIPNYAEERGFEEFLKSKHKLEVGLDDMAIRQRRFEEYQNKLSKYRKRLNALSHEIMDIYKNIFMNLGIIKKTIALSEPIFWEASSAIDMRLSWYWQGVILKHSQAKDLPQTAPKPNYEIYTEYLNGQYGELETLQQKVESVYKKFENI